MPTDHAHVRFTDIRVPHSAIFGGEGTGLQVTQHFFNENRIRQAASSLGAAQFCIDESVKYAMERKPFGKPLSSNQGIQFPLVELQTQAAMLRALIRQTAWEMDTNGAFSASDKVSMCNYYANRLCCEAADRAMQVHGGVGLQPAQPFEHIYRHHRRYRITEGAEEIQMRRVAGDMFGYMNQQAPKGVNPSPGAERAAPGPSAGCDREPSSRDPAPPSRRGGMSEAPGSSSRTARRTCCARSCRASASPSGSSSSSAPDVAGPRRLRGRRQHADLAARRALLRDRHGDDDRLRRHRPHRAGRAGGRRLRRERRCASVSYRPRRHDARAPHRALPAGRTRVQSEVRVERGRDRRRRRHDGRGLGRALLADGMSRDDVVVVASLSGADRNGERPVHPVLSFGSGPIGPEVKDGSLFRRPGRAGRRRGWRSAGASRSPAPVRRRARRAAPPVRVHRRQHAGPVAPLDRGGDRQPVGGLEVRLGGERPLGVAERARGVADGQAQPAEVEQRRGPDETDALDPRPRSPRCGRGR